MFECQTGDADSDAIYSRPIHDVRPSGTTESRPLVLYAYKESESARKNLEFFVKQGLHGRADFVFIFNGETRDSELVPQRRNIRIGMWPEAPLVRLSL